MLLFECRDPPWLATTDSWRWPPPHCNNPAAANAMSQFSFPILTDKEVAQCLNELGMNASVEQLTKPTFEFVQPVYENLVTALMGVTR